MAINKITKSGYGQIELNQVAWRRDGRIEAQCALDTTDFNDSDKKAENGMLLAVDNVSRKLFKATSALEAILPIGVHYSSEHIYDERTPGLKSFAVGTDDILPRVGYPAVGDKFTTNAIAYDSTEFVDQDALEDALAALATTPVYGIIATDGSGYIQATLDAPTSGLGFNIIEKTTMPDGQLAVKVQVLRLA
jgi:hypothetical protein